jgi:hypothetical protein
MTDNLALDQLPEGNTDRHRSQLGPILTAGNCSARILLRIVWRDALRASAA